MKERNLFGELMQGVEEMVAQRESRFAKSLDVAEKTLIADLDTNEPSTLQAMSDSLSSNIH